MSSRSKPAHRPPPTQQHSLPGPQPRVAANGLKRIIWTGAFAAVTIVGAIYGAGLKTQQEYKAEKTKIIEATPEERIQQLQARRGALVAQRIPVERKLGEIQARIRAAEQASEQQQQQQGRK